MSKMSNSFDSLNVLDKLHCSEQIINTKQKKLSEIKSNIQDVFSQMKNIKEQRDALQKRYLNENWLLVQEESYFGFSQQKIVLSREAKASLENKIETLKRKLEIIENQLSSDRQNLASEVFDMCHKLTISRNDAQYLETSIQKEIKQCSEDLKELDTNVLEIHGKISKISIRNHKVADQNEVEELKLKLNDIKNELSNEIQKFEQSWNKKQLLTDLPNTEPEFLRLKKELQILKPKTSKTMSKEIVQVSKEPIKVQNQKLRGSLKKRYKFMLNQRSLDEFWNIMK